jgi:hypothetical protein
LQPTSNIDHVTDLLTMPAVLAALPRQTLDAMTGNLLDDGCIRYPNMARNKGPSGNARYEMTTIGLVILRADASPTLQSSRVS